MATLKINTGAVEAGDYAAHVPQEDWRLLVSARASFVRVRLPHDCRELIRFVEEAEQMYAALGYKDVADFVRRGLELDPDLVDWAVRGLRTIKPDEPVTFDAAVKLGKRGGDRRSEKAKSDQGASSTLKRGSTSVDYTLARLERDGHVELASAVKAGEKSAAAARREAGYEKPADIVTVAVKAFLRLDAKQRRRFYDEVEKATK